MIHLPTSVDPPKPAKRGRTFHLPARLVRALPACAFLLALLPSAAWWLRRIADGTGELPALAALALFAAIAWRRRRELASGPGGRIAALVLLALACIPGLPQLVRCALVTAAPACYYGIHRSPALFGLLVVSLPLAASLDFFAGFPLRVAASEGAARLLDLAGIDAHRSGTMLVVRGATVGVDPACSGIRFLVHGGILAAALAALYRLDLRRSVALGLAALVAVVAANILRATILILPESGIVTFGDRAHELIGLACFALAIPPLAMIAGKLSGSTSASGIGVPPMTSTPRAAGALTSPLLVLAILSLFSASQTPSPATTTTPLTLPPTFRFDGHTALLEPLPLSPVEQHFAAGFPGAIARARWGAGELIVRRVDRPTRRLHPSARCLQGAGFHTGAARTVTTADGATWTRYPATRDGRRWLVFERIVATGSGRFWTDVSQWFWAAARSPRSGPWRAETLILPRPPLGAGFTAPAVP